jgi:hypothetical protein
MSLNGKTGGGGEEEEEAEVEDEISKKYNLDDYDDEGGGTTPPLVAFVVVLATSTCVRVCGAGGRFEQVHMKQTCVAAGVLGVAEDVVFQKNEDDPYITVRDVRHSSSPALIEVSECDSQARGSMGRRKIRMTWMTLPSAPPMHF